MSTVFRLARRLVRGARAFDCRPGPGHAPNLTQADWALARVPGAVWSGAARCLPARSARRVPPPIPAIFSETRLIPGVNINAVYCERL